MAGAETIKDRESFRAWLDAWPEGSRCQVALTLASRCALRVLPFAHPRGKRTPSQYKSSLKRTTWRNTISRTTRTWPDNEIAAAAAAYGAVYVTANNAAAAYAASAAAAFAADADLTNAVHAAVDAAIASAAAAGRYAADIWENIRLDANHIETGKEAFSLFEQHIWLKKPKWWQDSRLAFERQLANTHIDWSIWLRWYDTVAQGEPAFGLSRKAGDTVERAIALGGRDGKFHREFWGREPGEINREIAEWVAEARAAEALQDGQGNGVRFQYRNGLIALGKYLGLASPHDDRKRIESNLPQLADLADVLQAALDAREAPYPPLLLKTLSRFSALVKSTPADIEPEHLHAATTLLRGQVDSAAKPSATSNVPPLEDSELALAKSITMISDLVVMGTVRGKALFDDADRVSFDAGPDEKFLKLSRELFELVKTHGGIMDAAAVDLLLDVLISGNLAPHPKRVAFLQEGSAKNALIVFGAVGLFLIATPGAGALAFLTDKLVDVGIVIGIEYKVNDSARNKIDAFILKYENKLREIAKHKESLKWLEDVLYLREQHRKRQKDDLKK